MKMELRSADALGKDVVNDVAFDVGQAKIAAGVAVGESLVVEAEEVQNRGM
jgi:hypothetical protein